MVFVTGDTHGRFERFDLGTAFRKNHFTCDDYVIICGDFGGVWHNDCREEDKLNKLAGLPFTILFADGNHENYDLLSSYPIEEWHGGKCQYIRENVIHLMRGQIYKIEGKSYFVMGGAACHDIQDGVLDITSPFFEEEYFQLRKRRARFRVRGVSWWSQELPSETELAEGWEALCAIDKKVDIIITHCAPSGIQREVVRKLHDDSYKENVLTEFLQRVYDECEFTEWYCGHYHQEMRVGKLQIIYEKIENVQGITTGKI